MGLITGLIVLQRDISTAALMFVTAMSMVFVAGADIKQILPTIIMVALAVAGAALVLRHGERIFSWLSTAFKGIPEQETQVAQCLAAINRGGLFGVGLGQSQFKYIIYAAHSDSIFAIIGEELVSGASVVVGLRALTWWGIGWRAKRRPARPPAGYRLTTWSRWAP